MADIQASCVAETLTLGFPATRLDLNEALPYPDGAFYKVRILKGRSLGMEGEHFRFFVKTHLESLFEKNGFRIIGRNSSGHLPFMDGRWVRRLLGQKRVVFRIPEWLEPLCAINFLWLAERVPLPPKG